MAKKIRFSLDMGQDILVSTLEDLQENFNLEKVKEYFLDGRLLTWLEDRYYEDEAEAIEELDKDDIQLGRKLCEVFEVEYDESQDSSLALMEKISKLKQYTDDEEIFAHAGQVAFNQEELADLLDEGMETIYLCGTKFNIPVRKKGITYIGVNRPIVKYVLKDNVTLEGLGIKLENVEDSDSIMSKRELIGKVDSYLQEEVSNPKKSFVYIQVLEIKNKYDMNEDIKVLFMDTEDESEIRVSVESENSVVDYCESDDYIFYVLSSARRETFDMGNLSFFNYGFEEKNRNVVYRFNKSTRETKIIKLICTEDICVYDKKYRLSRSKFTDENDSVRTDGENGYPRTLFCYKNNLFIRVARYSENCIGAEYSYGKIIKTDLDGKHLSKIAEIDDCVIGFIYNNCIYYVNKNSLGNLCRYDLKTKKVETIGWNPNKIYTNGSQVLYYFTKNCSPEFWVEDVGGENKRNILKLDVDKDRRFYNYKIDKIAIEDGKYFYWTEGRKVEIKDDGSTKIF